ncbi:TraB/GumN family protein [Photobacterium damselae]|uniref:TraB/GumN family protein n=1 Tax=Photobacterium damselae subsp. damselae TaxID=85581 RepID=A0A7Y7UGV5_PHODD|nr:TraB/GumN family protein [Photobacterium damselae]NVO61517.1 TraB/GumN family protein [Photobacterium damselae subsp. damselae]NVP00327.1 TraB/GumN family protein [Photobacterium damselae subsp. damselae]
MRKYIYALLLPFLSFSALSAPLVWQAQKGDVNFYFLGSIHAGKKTFYPLPSEFMEHWSSANALIVEANILSSTEVKPDLSGPTTKQQLTPKQQEQLKVISDTLSLPYSHLLTMPPWLSAINLQMALTNQLGLDPQQGVDYQLLLKAQHDKLPIKELEGVEQQFALLANLPEHGTPMLQETVTNWEQLKQDMTDLITAWQTGDQTKLNQLFTNSQFDDQSDEQLIFGRNKQWAHLLSDPKQYPAGNYLVVVGAFHLLGDKGVPALLAEEGFIIKRVSE